MDGPCTACSSNPCGFAGHAALMVRTLGDARMTLQCHDCASLWSRTLAREGCFTWDAITEQMAAGPQMGIRVPPLSTDQTYRSCPT